MKKFFLVPLLLLLIVFIFFLPFFLHKNLPIPSDTIVGLYHPFRDLYAKQYPNGIPYKNFLITDPVRQQYPWRWLAVQLERQGQVALWNPYNFAGTPLLANFQTAAFYPLNILLLLLPFPIGWGLLIILEPLLAGLFMYLYLSHLRLNHYARFLGSFVYAFCGYMTAWMEWGTMDQIVLWLPLLLLSTDKLFQSSLRGIHQKVETNAKVWSAVFVLSLTCSFLAGNLQPFFYVFIISFFYFLVRLAQSKQKKRMLILYVVLLILFFLITAVQWIPTAEFILQSARNADQLNGWQQPGWFIPWQHLAQFIAPDFFGNPVTLNYWGVWNYGEFIGYVGIFPLLIALYALFFRRDGKTLFFGTFFFLSLLFSLPTFFAQIPYLLQIPFFATSQPTRMLLITDFSLAVLAALGLDFYMSTLSKRKILYPTSFLLLMFSILWGISLFGYKIFHFSQENLLVAKHNLYFPTGLFLCIVLLILATIFIKKVKVQMAIVIILLLISVVDVFRFSNKFNPSVSQLYLFPQDPTLRYLQQQPGQFRVMTTDSELLPPNFSIMYHLQSLDGYDPLYLQRYGELMIAISRNKPDIHTPFGFNRIITPTTVSSRLIDLLGVRYILSLSDIKEPKLEKVFAEGQTQIYKNNQVFPRAFFVNSIKQAENKNAAITDLFDTNIDLHNTAIVEGWNKQNEIFTVGSATIREYQPNAVTIDTRNDGQGFLVLTDTFYPTWHVTIDGSEGNIYRTDYNFRGVIIPKGAHTIVFSDSLF